MNWQITFPWFLPSFLLCRIKISLTQNFYFIQMSQIKNLNLIKSYFIPLIGLSLFTCHYQSEDPKMLRFMTIGQQQLLWSISTATWDQKLKLLPFLSFNISSTFICNLTFLDIRSTHMPLDIEENRLFSTPSPLPNPSAFHSTEVSYPYQAW